MTLDGIIAFIADRLPPGMDMEGLILLLTALSAAFTLGAIWYGLLQQNPSAQRARRLATTRSSLRHDLLHARAGRRAQMQVEPVSAMKRLLEALDLLKNNQTRKISRSLIQAGIRGDDALVRFLFFKLALPPIIGIVAALLLFVFDLWPLMLLQKIMIALFAVLAAAFMPDIYVKNAATKRQQALLKALPDALDLLVICAEAGLSLDAMLKRVAEELGEAMPEMAEELTITSLELGFLPERRKALENLAERAGIAGIRGLVTTLLQAERYGTPLAHSLRVLSAEFRQDRMTRAEEKAARLPSLLTLPMIVFVMPPLVIVLVTPGILQAMDAWVTK